MNNAHTIQSEFLLDTVKGTKNVKLEHKIEISETILQGNIITAETLGSDLTHRDVICMTLNERIYLN